MRAWGIFLDKDGTLLEDVPYNVDPQRMRLAPGAAAGLRTMSGLGAHLLVVSNQAGIAFGRCLHADMKAVETRLAAMFRDCGATLAAFRFCPHHPGGHVAPYRIVCSCRKPRPGMLLRAAIEHRLDIRASWMIGDILDDVEAGRRAGCRTILIHNGNETEWRLTPERTPHCLVRTLHEAAHVIRMAAVREGHCASGAGRLVPS